MITIESIKEKLGFDPLNIPEPKEELCHDDNNYNLFKDLTDEELALVTKLALEKGPVYTSSNMKL